MSSGGKPPACPACGRADQTQPVQAIVDQQVTHASGHGDMVGVGLGGSQLVAGTGAYRSFSTARSSLVQMLELPSPARPRNLAAWGVVLIVALVILPLAFGLLLAGLGTVDDSSPWTTTLAYLVVLSPGILVGIVLIVVHVRNQRAWRQQVVRWERARSVWMTLRYCHRDHLVYQPPNVHFPPAETRRFVYGTVT